MARIFIKKDDFSATSSFFNIVYSLVKCHSYGKQNDIVPQIRINNNQHDLVANKEIESSE